MDRLKAAYDTISALDKDKESMNRVNQEAYRMVRVLTVLREYVLECDDSYGEERAILPLSRYVYVKVCLFRLCFHETTVASGKGKNKLNREMKGGCNLISYK